MSVVAHVTRQDCIDSLFQADLIFDYYVSNDKVSPIAHIIASKHFESDNSKDFIDLCYSVVHYPVFEKVIWGISLEDKIQELRLLQDWLSLFSCEYERLGKMPDLTPEEIRENMAEFIEKHLPASFKISL